MSESLQPYGLQSTRLHCPWDSPGENTGEGCHTLLQGGKSIDCELISRHVILGGSYSVRWEPLKEDWVLPPETDILSGP